MAIAFARVSIHTRTQGHSAVAGAAYRAGTLLFDQQLGKTFDFRNRHDVIFSEIRLPEGGDQQYLDREHLWNTVEACEKRKDAQVAKDVILALPRDVDLVHQVTLARNFADTHFVSKGLVADIAIHNHSDGNPHAHIYITTRRLRGDHFDRYKARDLNPVFSNGTGGKGFISEQDYWGEQWRGLQNDYFVEQDLNLEVDENHLIAQRHHGRVRDGEDHYLKTENALTHLACKRIALDEPENVINVLSTRYAVFTERHVWSVLFKSTQTREEFEQAMVQVQAHPDIICLGVGHDGRLRYTTRANYHKEVKLGEQATALTRSLTQQLSEKAVKHHLSSSYAASGLDSAASPGPTTSTGLTPEQQRALHHVLTGPGLCAIVGRAGTGKSYLLFQAREVWEREGFQVMGIAVSGIAAKGLMTSSGIPSSTLASFKRKVIDERLVLSDKTIVVMDEAGMTDLEDMAFVVDAVASAGAKLVVVGDPQQLQPIGPGAPFRALVEQVGYAELSQIKRQSNPGDRTAAHQLAQGDVAAALDYFDEKGRLHWHRTAEDAMGQLIANWATTLQDRSLSDQVIIAHRNVDVAALNQRARERLIKQGLVNTQSTAVTVVKRVPSTDGWGVQFDEKTIPLAPGDRILFRRNDRTLGVHNGEFATVVAMKGDHLTVRRDLEQSTQTNALHDTPLTFSLSQYNEFDYGYATTVHKVQGATFDRVFVYAGGHGWNRHLAYVALTRHRNHVEIHLDRETHPEKAHFKAAIQRADIEDSVLDWPMRFAQRRGFDPEGLIGRLIERLGLVKETIQDHWRFLTDYARYRGDTFTQQSNKNQNEHGQHPPVERYYHPLRDRTLEWQALRGMDAPAVKVIDKLYRCVHPDTPDTQVKALYQKMIPLMRQVHAQPSIMTTLQTKTPHLHQHIEQVVQSKAPAPDWRAALYRNEWTALRKINAPGVQSLLKQYELLANKEKTLTTTQRNRINNTITERSNTLLRDPALLRRIQTIAPRLTEAFKQAHWHRARTRIRSQGRDRE